MPESNRPVHEIKLGRIRASIWLNNGNGGASWHSVSLTRIYREDDRWNESSSFGRDDLPIVSKAAEMAYRWIWDAQQQEPAR